MKTLEDLIDDSELDELRGHYGPFQRQHVTIAMEPGSLDFYRRAFKNRRGEILFALFRPNGDVLLHTKAHYPEGLYRLPGGGVDWGEPVRSCLGREVGEETQMSVSEERFLGVLSYQFTGAEPSVPFISYVFAVPNVQGEPAPADETEQITGFKWVPLAELTGTAEMLRSLPNDGQGLLDWGRFRAVGHDFVVEQCR